MLVIIEMPDLYNEPTGKFHVLAERNAEYGFLRLYDQCLIRFIPFGSFELAQAARDLFLEWYRTGCLEAGWMTEPPYGLTSWTKLVNLIWR
jgi:hypothetical protein